ncbi:MAG: hypothetical protein K8J08_11675 [Thermoanaerobaculia bacterium]|nr:hypothetical protein [Thermoanaerobaculia bacterium]
MSGRADRIQAGAKSDQSGLLPVWRRSLEALPEPAQRVLGPWAATLEAALGQLHQSSRPQGDDDVDGYGNLTHGGSYERLLASEWALLSLSPLEFLRRAAMNEHLFLEYHRRRPKEGLHHVVLIDAGPEQLGAPRLAQLAALAVFERRAQAARAIFSWAVLQDSERQLQGGVEKEAVSEWFSVASLASPSGDLAAWRDLLGPLRGGELWLVTAPAVGRTANAVLPPHGQLLIQELSRWSDSARAFCDSALHHGRPLERLLEVQIVPPDNRGSSSPQRVLLPMPSATAALGVLRRPFREEHPRTGINITTTGVRILPGGNHMLLRDRQNRLAVLPLQQGRNTFQGRLRYFPDQNDSVIVAAGLLTHQRTRVALRWDEDRGVLKTSLSSARHDAETDFQIDEVRGSIIAAARAANENQESLPAPLFLLGSVRDLWVLLGESLIRIFHGRATLVQDSVATAYWARGNGVVAITRAHEGEQSVIFFSGRGAGRTLFRIPAGKNEELAAGFPGQSGYPAGALAVHHSEGWSIHVSTTSRFTLRPESEERVVGITASPSAGIGLLTLDAERSRLLFRGRRDRVDTLVRAREPIIEVATSVQTSRVIARTESQLLGISVKYPGNTVSLVADHEKSTM